MPATWVQLNTTLYSGERLSPIFDISPVKRVRTSIITFTKTTPTGTAVVVETNVSLDGGVTWLGWQAATSGENVPQLPLGTVVTNARIQIRTTLTSDTLNTPQLTGSIGLVLTPGYMEASWIGEEMDISSYDVADDMVTWTVDTNGTIQAYTRGRILDGSWGEWISQPKDAPLVTQLPNIQHKLEFIPSLDLTATPEMSAFRTDIGFSDKRGYWISESVDVSQAKNLASGKVVYAYVSTTGVMNIFSRSRVVEGGVWSDYSLALNDGSLTHPANNFIQLLVLMTGYNTQLTEMTLIFDGEANAQLLATGLTPGGEYDFTVLRDKLIIANGRDATKKWDGETATIEELSGSAPVLKVLETHHNRIWGVDSENPSRVRYSAILDPETWGAFDFIDFNPEDGDYITALMRYGQNLIISKKRSMALLTGNKSTNYNVSWLDSEQGVTGLRAITQADKYVCYVAQDGIRFTDLAQSVVATERLLPDWDRINHRRLNQASMVYWRNKLLVALPTSNSLINNEVWVYDFLRNSWSILKGWNVYSWLKFTQYGEDVLLASDSEQGQVYEVMVTNYDDATPISYAWKSKDFHFGHPERYKLFRTIFLDIEGVVEATLLEILMYVDGVYAGTYTTTIPAGEGVKHTRRVLPPLYNAVLGRMLTLELRGRCGVQGIAIEYVVRGAVPGGDF